MPLASNIPLSSSKVMTKSTSLRTLRRLASNFLAAQGPIKTTRHPGRRRFCSRAVSTIGVMVMEIYGAKPGNSFLAITDHAGQQEVAINGCFSGTIRKNSSASSTAHRSAPTATSSSAANPNCCMAALICPGVTLSPNWPQKAGAITATTSSPRRMAWISWNSWPLSTIAPKGQFTRHIPQLTHLS